MYNVLNVTAIRCICGGKILCVLSVEGKCVCVDGFGGSDCSFDTRNPPTVTSLSDDGVCDKSEKTCEDTTLYGHYFFENMSTTCYVTRQEVLITLSIICYGHFFLAIKYFYK